MGERSATFQEALSSVLFWCLLLSLFGMSLFMTGVNFHMIGFGKLRGFTETQTSDVFVGIAIGQAICCFGLGFCVVDYLPKALKTSFKVIILLFGAGFICLAMLLAYVCNSLFALYTLGVVLGCGQGVVMSVGSI